VKNICVLFDFENIVSSLQENYQLALTSDGFKKTISYVHSLGSTELKNIFVSAYWDNYKSYKQFPTITGTKKVDVPINTKNAADGALIIELMKLKVSSELDKITTIVLFAGDGGYGSLVRYLYEEQKEVIIISVKNCTKDELAKLAQHTWIEDILEIKDKYTYNHQFLFKTTILPEWKSVVVKAKSFTKLPYLDKNYLAKQVYQSYDKHPPLNAYNTLEKCKKLVSDCCENGLFIEAERIVEDGKKTKYLIINSEHILIKDI